MLTTCPRGNVSSRQCQPKAMSRDDLIIRSSSSYLPFARQVKIDPATNKFRRRNSGPQKKTFIRRTLNCKCQFCLFPHWIGFVILILADLRVTHFNIEPNSHEGANEHILHHYRGTWQYLTGNLAIVYMVHFNSWVYNYYFKGLQFACMCTFMCDYYLSVPLQFYMKQEAHAYTQNFTAISLVESVL